MNRTLWKSALGVCMGLITVPSDVLAGRGGGYGGGRGSYGGGGYGGGQRGEYGGGGQRGEYGGESGGSHSPSFSQPRSPSGGSGSASGQYGNRNSSGGSGGAAAAGAGYANKNQRGSHDAGAAAAGAGYSNKNQSTLPNNGAAAAGAGYANKNQSTLPNNGAAAGGAAYANRNQSALPNNGAAAAGAGYANRNQSALPNNGAAAVGAGYANRNQSALPNNGAAAAGAGYANRNNSNLPYNGAAAVGAGYANRNDANLPYNGAGAMGAAASANNANNNNGYNGLGAAAVGAGAWNGNNSGAWGNGMGAGGVGAWGAGSPQYGYGYSNYNNPYAGGAVGGQSIAAGAPPQGGAPMQAMNYAQPLSTTSAPPASAAADEAVSAFAQARAAFKAGDYDNALSLTQQALAQAPSDSTMHQFLALVLFAQGKYDQAAAPLYAVLSVGPGWDWTTLSGMYPDVSTYTAQLRNLESYARDNPNSAHARFVLAYQYLCEGHDANAVEQLRYVVRLQPADTLSAQLVAKYHPAGAAQPAPEPSAAEVAPGAEGKLAGKWVATPAEGASIALAIGDDGGFSWTVSGPGKPATTIAGSSTFADGVLTLAGKGQNGALAGKVAWQDADHFTFRLVSAPSQDPGLKFAR